jgi:hypothetical protein
MAAAAVPVVDPVNAAAQVLDAAAAEGLTLRATGGVAVALCAPSAHRAPLQRSYQDVDFVALSRDAHAVAAFFTSLGYTAEEEFNLLHGQRRLFFVEPDGRWQADVFLDRIEMCHTLELRDRLGAVDRTLAPADLLLSKLQVVRTNAKDVQDALALLADHDLTDDDSGVSVERLVEVCANDWGWWRTVTMVAQRTREGGERHLGASDEAASAALRRAIDRLDELVARLDAAPKSRKWKLRARVGDRVRWHEEPEDIEHEEQS